MHAVTAGDVSGIAGIIGGDGPSGVVGWGLALGVCCGEQVVLTPRTAQAPTLTYDCETWNVPEVTQTRTAP